MLKFYTNIEEITPENRKRVFPMLFDWFYLENPLVRDCFKCVEAIEDADVCILPVDLGFYLLNDRKQELDVFVATAKKLEKKIWIYSGGDFGTTLLDDVFMFRLGGFHSKMNTNTFVLPSFINDPFNSILKNNWHHLIKEEKPTIGFVGNADGSFFKWIKEVIIYSKQSLNRLLEKDFTDKQVFFPSSSIRFKLLEKLRISEMVEVDFIYRNKYRGGATTEAQKNKTTLEFYKNIERNLYIFCLRGSGNFSVRFYETLMMGRIPILVNTDVRLPFYDKINWDKHCVFTDSDTMIKDLLQFHKSHTNQELIEIQKSNRELALGLLNRQKYFIEISKQFY